MSESYVKKIQVPSGAEYVLKDSNTWNALDMRANGIGVSNVINDIYAKLGAQFFVSYEDNNTLAFSYNPKAKLVNGVSYIIAQEDASKQNLYTTANVTKTLTTSGPRTQTFYNSATVPEGTYTISVNILDYNEGSNPTLYIQLYMDSTQVYNVLRIPFKKGRSSATVTTPAFNRVYCFTSSSATPETSVTFNQIMIEAGETASPYYIDPTEGVKTAPAGAKLAKVISLDGGSYQFNQMFNPPVPGNANSATKWTASGCTATDLGNGLKVVVTSNGGVYRDNALSAVIGHKYYVVGSIDQDVKATMVIRMNSSSTNLVNKSIIGFTRLGCIGEATTATCRVYFRGTTGSTFILYDVEAVDLTLMFGEGNEPTDTTDARIVALENYLVNHYAYNPGTIMDAHTVLTSKLNGAVISSIGVPTTLLAKYPLRSAGSVHDTLSYENGRWIHTQRVKKAKIGDFSYAYNSTANYFSVQIADMAVCTATSGVGGRRDGFMVESYFIPSAIAINSTMPDKAALRSEASILYVRDTAYTSAADFVAAQGNKTFYYELATPIVTDVTAEMTWDGTFNVEAGSTITPECSNGVAQDVNYTLEYTIDPREATT